MQSPKWIRILTGIFFSLGAPLFSTGAYSHELPENRANLVLRDERQVSATFYFRLSEVLHQTLTPALDRFEHTAKLAAMNEIEFGKQYGISKKIIESSVLFKVASGKPLKMKQWNWPDAKAAQKHIRELTMQVVVGSAQHVHEESIEVRLQMQSDISIQSLWLELPDFLKPMTIVANRPKQSRLDISTKKMAIEF